MFRFFDSVRCLSVQQVGVEAGALAAYGDGFAFLISLAWMAVRRVLLPMRSVMIWSGGRGPVAGIRRLMGRSDIVKITARNQRVGLWHRTSTIEG